MAENPRIEELRRRVLADPASIAFAALAEEFRRVGRYEEAIETCRTGLQRHPAYLSARVTLGRALIETSDYEGAREQLETVLRSAPENLAAIRGIAQIDELLSHSTEMDPHIADVMHTMHEESLRAAAERVPVVSAPPPVEPALELRGGPDPPVADLSPAPQPEPPLSMSSGTAPADGAEAPVDVFASFASASSVQAPAHDLSFDLSSAFSVPQKTDPQADAPVDFSMAPSAVAPVPEPIVERVQDPVVEPVLDRVIQPDAEVFAEELSEPLLQAEPAFEPEDEPAIESGPDPEVLATLARLERFLGAIQSLRA
jgi:tetratricopeptide (TPR) repeat protein